MSQPPIFSPQSVLSGAVCTFIFTITSEGTQRSSDELYYHYVEQQQRLVSEVEGMVKQILGEEFKVQDFRINRGSVEIILVIGTTYYVISKYKNFIDSIDLLFSQLQNLFKRFAPPNAPVKMAGNWALDAALARAYANSPKSVESRIIWALLLYILISHAALLSLFIYQSLKR